MKRALPAILTGVIAVILLDTLGSIASRQMNFNYTWFAPVSFIIYVAVAFVIAKRTDRKTAIISAGLLGLFDATVGWKISMLLQANTGDLEMEFTPAVLITTVIFMTLLACLFGLFGSWLATKFSKEQTDMPIKKEEGLISSIKNQPMNKVTCTNCGAENSAYLKFCSSCGHTLPKPEEPIVEIAPPEPDTFTARVNKHKGLVGAVFGIIFFALAVFAVQRLYSRVASLSNLRTASAFENVIEMTAKELNQKCPMMVDEVTRLDNVEALPGNMFQYNYTLVSIGRDDVDPDTLKKYIEPEIINNIRTNPEMEIYRKIKTTFVYQYHDKSSVPILKILVTPGMYE